jgi:hypothetical protein
MYDSRLGRPDSVTEEPRKLETLLMGLAGFDLCAYQISGGRFQLGSIQGHGEIIDAFPQAVQIGHRVYTLEDVKNLGHHGFVNAIYV